MNRFGRSPRFALAAAAFGAGALWGWVVGRLARRQSPPGKFVGAAGQRMHYVQAGVGRDVVLIHGTGLTLHDMMAGPFDRLAATCRVTAFDRPGHGFSDPPTGAADAESQARIIRDAVLALGLERPTIVGHSLGGAVALAYGALWPEEVGGVVAISPFAYRDWTLVHLPAALHTIPWAGGFLTRTILALTDTLSAPAAGAIAFAPQAPTGRFLRLLPPSLTLRPEATRQDGLDVMQTTAAIDRLSRRYVTYPTAVHVLVGESDKILNPTRHAERLALALGPRGRLVTLPGVGHMAHHFAQDQIAWAIDEVRLRAGGLRGVAMTAAAQEFGGR